MEKRINKLGFGKLYVRKGCLEGENTYKRRGERGIIAFVKCFWGKDKRRCERGIRSSLWCGRRRGERGIRSPLRSGRR